MRSGARPFRRTGRPELLERSGWLPPSKEARGFPEGPPGTGRHTTHRVEPGPDGLRSPIRARIEVTTPLDPIPLVNLARQYRRHRTEIDAAIRTTLERSAFIGGEIVARFEHDFARYCGSATCVGVNSGTDALYLSLRALGVGPGDEVIIPAASFIATAEAVTLTGARPVFADVDSTDLLMDPDEAAAAIGPNTRAIIPVHLYGQLAPLDPLLALSKRHGLFLIEDAAQAHGASDGQQRAGSVGHTGCFSFYPGKNLGAYGDAGAIITDDQRLASRIRMLANHGRTSQDAHVIEGVNSRLDGLQAAVLTVKLKHLDRWTEARRRAATRYDALLDDIEGLERPRVRNPHAHVFHVYVVRVVQREKLRAHLAERGIQTGLHYPTPLPYLPAYRHLGYPIGRFPRAEAAMRGVLSLPICPEITARQQERVAHEIRRFLETNP